MMRNTLSILTILVPFDNSYQGLQKDTKIIKIDKILAFVMHQKILCNGVLIVHPGHHQKSTASTTISMIDSSLVPLPGQNVMG